MQSFMQKKFGANNVKITRFHWSRKSRDSCPTSSESSPCFTNESSPCFTNEPSPCFTNESSPCFTNESSPCFTNESSPCFTNESSPCFTIACVAGGIRGYKEGSLKYRLPKN